MNVIRTDDLPQLFQAVADRITEASEELSAMDAKMGDGDLGLTMKKGFGALPGIMEEMDEPSLSKKLIKAGMKMSSLVPSTMGTLMSSGIMSGGKALAGKEEMDAEGYLLYLKGFSEGIIKRGKCKRGDRTVLDAVGSAVDAVAKALSDQKDLTLPEAAEAAVKGAEAGVEATRSMEPRFGKAAVHKAVAAGVPDQGACAGLYMIEGYRNFLIRK